MPIIEINSPEYAVSEISQEMGRASIMRFRRIADFSDDAQLPRRSIVCYTVNGVRLFAGTVIPAGIIIADEDADGVEYIAADIMEYLGHNPCDEVNLYYNRTLTDQSVYDYPDNRSVRQIIETELASIVGAGKPIGAMDWGDVSTEVQGLVPRNFSVKGRTWVGLLDAIVLEVPVLSYWYDPATTSGDSVRGGTLRWFDLSRVPTPPKYAALPVRGTGASVVQPNIVSGQIQVDTSKSYDRLELHGWGNMQERRERLTRAWSTDQEISGRFSIPRPSEIIYPLRQKPGGGASSDIQLFVPDSSDGTWIDVTPSMFGMPWHPEAKRVESRWVGRRYRTSHPIVDLKLLRSGTGTIGDPYRYSRAESSMNIQVPYYRWYAGPVSFTTPSSSFVQGLFVQGVKITAFSNGYVDDWGSVTLIRDLYPNWATDNPDGGPLESIGPPAAFENAKASGVEIGFVLLAQARVARTSYLWRDYIINPGSPPGTELDWLNLTNASGAPNPNTQTTFVFWDISYNVWMEYTSKSDMVAVREDLTLGYDRTLRLLDPRFLVYAQIGAVSPIRDDTAQLSAFADVLFSMVKRDRVLGSLTLIANPSSVNTDWPMGCAIQIVNWRSGTATHLGAPSQTIMARVQRRTFTNLVANQTIEIGFDRDATFTPIEMLSNFRAFFERSEITGETANAPLGGIPMGVGSGGAGSGGGGAGGGGSNSGGSSGGIGWWPGSGFGGSSGGGSSYVGSDCCTVDGGTPDPFASGSGI